MPSVLGCVRVSVANCAACLSRVEPLGVVGGIDRVLGEGAQGVGLQVDRGAAPDVAILDKLKQEVKLRYGRPEEMNSLEFHYPLSNSCKSHNPPCLILLCPLFTLMVLELTSAAEIEFH